MDTMRLDIDSEGIGWVTFDDPSAKVNLINPAVALQLGKILEDLAQRRPKAVVFISGKPDVFIAGADIKEISKIADAAEGERLARAGHQLLGRLERLGMPTVAAIHGACLGGGCELILACSHRVATDHSKTQIGLPETQLGIIPGWGGTQRLSRLIGLRAALRMIVTGNTVDGLRAWKMGLVDQVVPVVALRETAKRIALGAGSAVRRPARWDTWWGVRGCICRRARKETLARTGGHYPAPLRAIDAVERGLATSLDRGLEMEARMFGELAVASPCKNLIRVFFLREKYSRRKIEPLSESLAGPKPAARIAKVGVIGAGTMGAGIAQWCSARGLTVRLKDVRPGLVAAGMKRIAEVYCEAVRRRKLTESEARLGLARVHPTTEYSGFADCDIVIEAVVERLEIKRQVFGELLPLIRENCILASNTSALPIDDLGAACGRPGWLVGVHFFNPVHKMPLVEIVRGTETAPEVLAAALGFAGQLRKIAVIVRGAPGFLVNRLLMPYLNEAAQMLEDGMGVAEIDRAMREFGMPMGPLRLIDEVGIDVAADVAGELAAAFRDRMAIAPVLERMHRAGWKGRKGGAGFYVYGGNRERVNPAILPLIGDGGGRGSRLRGRSRFGVAEARRAGPLLPAEIQKRLVGVMIAEARRVLDDRVVETEDDVDAGMIFGTGFPPFRGGLVRYARDAGWWEPAAAR